MSDMRIWRKLVEALNEVSEVEESRALAGAALATEQDLSVQEMPDGWYKVSVDATGGPLVSLIRTLAYQARSHSRTKSGGKLPHHHLFKANGVLIKAATRDVLDAKIARALKHHNAYVKSETRHKERAPQRAADNAVYNAKRAKERRAELETLYGKGTANRVKYKQVGGDDGYQYMVFVDGRVIATGMSQSSAQAEARQQMDYIAKKEKLGKYADKPFYPELDEGIVQVPDGLRGEQDSRLKSADAHRFLNELDPTDSVDTEVVDPETGEILDWPTKDTERKQQQDAEYETWHDNYEADALAPKLHLPRNYESAWNLLNDLRDSEFYEVEWRDIRDEVDNPDELMELDYDVDMTIPVAIKRKDGRPIDSDDQDNFQAIAYAVKKGSTMGNIALGRHGLSDNGTVAHFGPEFV